MKFVFCAGLILLNASCSLERYSKVETAELKISIPRSLIENKAGAKAGPGDYSTVDCFVLDVNGPGIDSMYEEDSAFGPLDLGLNSQWFQRTDLVAAGTTSLDIRVPIGRARTVRILGVSGITGACAAQTFAGFPEKGVLATPPYPVVNELARATLDIFAGKALATAELADRAEDMIPNNTVTLAGRANLLIGNSLSDFSEGAPGAGSFITFTVPRSTDGLSGKARLDLVLNVTNINVRPFRGLQIQAKAAGGSVATCGSTGPAILTPSALTIGLWNEDDFQWSVRPNFILSSNQTATYTANFSGAAFEKVRTNITDGGGSFSALYLSLRVQDTPGTGCSAINLTEFSATLYQ